MMISIPVAELVNLNNLLEASLETADKLREQWDAIKWSTDKDNMAFSTVITAFQKEEIDRLFEILLGKSGA